MARFPRPMRPGVKRWIVLTHTYLGVAFALLFVMWFASGIVLAYSPFPSLSADDRLRFAPALDCASCRVSEAEAKALLGIQTARVGDASALGMLGTRPVWRIVDDRLRWHAVFADIASVVPMVDSTTGSAIALGFARSRRPDLPATVRASYVSRLTEPDQWTLEQPMPSQLPMLRYDLNDDDGTRVYISQAGAEVVTLSVRHERALAYLGAIPHWIYPTLLRRHVRAWSGFVILLSALGTLMSIAGLTIGIWQWRWRARARRTSEGRPRPRSPYREFVMRWHHLLGLVFGLCVCSWVFSGLMSMNPGEWSPGSTPDTALRERWSGDGGALATAHVTAIDAWRVMIGAGDVPHTMQLDRIGGHAFWVGQSAGSRGVLIDADAPGAGVTDLTESALIANAVRCLDGAQLIDVALLKDGDDYFRQTPEHHLDAPVLRLRFADTPSTWLYVDPAIGALKATFASRSRLERWLYSGLHDFDFRWLLSHRPLWDVVVVGLSIGGLLGSLSGAVLAIRWLRDFRRLAPRYRRR